MKCVEQQMCCQCQRLVSRRDSVVVVVVVVVVVARVVVVVNANRQYAGSQSHLHDITGEDGFRRNGNHASPTVIGGSDRRLALELS